MFKGDADGLNCLHEEEEEEGKQKSTAELIFSTLDFRESHRETGRMEIGGDGARREVRVLAIKVVSGIDTHNCETSP